MSIPYIESITLGCDPELFLSRETGLVRKRKSIIGSEAVLPAEDLVTKIVGYGQIVRDGVQVELHPAPSTCRESLAFHIKMCMDQLNNVVTNASNTKPLGGLTIDFSQVVQLSKGDLMRISPDSRQLGCTPSLNIYGRKPVKKDGSTFLTRSAAGHIHLSSPMFSVVDPVRVVRILDVLVGNTCVLMDRDARAAERRKVYGRAGEYRLPTHSYGCGLEYRTLSNFWLRNYTLMSGVMGLAKLACIIGQSDITIKHFRGKFDGTPIRNFEKELMDRVDLSLIEKAINTNDFELALSNYNTMVRPFLATLTDVSWGLDASRLDAFDHFVIRIRNLELAAGDGLNYWFRDDPLQHWLSLRIYNNGWEAFLAHTVTGDARKLASIPPLEFKGIVMTPVMQTPVIIGDNTPMAYITPPATVFVREAS